MVGSVNKVVLVGNLGRDPEVRNTQEGTKIVQLSVATSEAWKDKATGERRDRTEWHRVVVFNERLADVCEKYLKRGSKIYLEGQVQTRKWVDPNTGQDKYTTEIILQKYRGELVILDSRQDQGGHGFSEPHFEAPYVAGDAHGSTHAQSHDLDDDDIPF